MAKSALADVTCALQPLQRALRGRTFVMLVSSHLRAVRSLTFLLEASDTVLLHLGSQMPRCHTTALLPILEPHSKFDLYGEFRAQTVLLIVVSVLVDETGLTQQI